MPVPSRTRSALFILALALALGGCGLSRKMATVAPTERAPRGLPSDEELEVGEIAFVRGTKKPFVLIRMVHDLPLPEQARLQTRPGADRASALLQLSSERRGAYRTADILSGQPRLGERVVFPYPAGDPTDPPASSPVGQAVAAEAGMVAPSGAEVESLEPVADPLPEASGGPAAPIRVGERVQIRTTVGEELPTVYEIDPARPEAIDDALPLPSRSALPGEEVPFIETVDDAE